MQFDNSDDEYGFWEPERPRRQRTPRSASGSPGLSSRPSGDDPTRQLRRSRPAGDEPTRQLRRVDGGRRHGSESPAGDPSHDTAPAVARRSDANIAYLDELSELLDLDVAAAMGADIPVVAVTARRSWRTRMRREDGRVDPFAARVGVVLLVGLVAIPIGAGLSDGSSAARAARPAAAVAAPSSPTLASSGSGSPTAAPSGSLPAEESAVDAVTVASAVAASEEPVVLTAAAAAVQPADAPATNAAVAESTMTPASPATAAATTAAVTAPDRAATVTPEPTNAGASGGQSKPEALLAGSSRNACTSSYTLVAGDYWLGIADRADVKLGALLIANAATSSTPLYPGRSICLPAGATTPLPPASTTTDAPPAVAPTTANPTTASTKPATTPTVARKATTTTAAATSSPATKAPATKAPATTAPTSTTRSKTAPATPAPKTTVAATTTAAPTTTVPKRTYSRDQVAQIIRDAWPDDLEDKAIAIATRESNLQPQVRNFCCFGLFQIYYGVHQGWLSGIGITSADQLYDPTTNAQAALALYNRNGGWGPWGG